MNIIMYGNKHFVIGIDCSMHPDEPWLMEFQLVGDQQGGRDPHETLNEFFGGPGFKLGSNLDNRSISRARDALRPHCGDETNQLVLHIVYRLQLLRSRLKDLGS